MNRILLTLLLLFNGLWAFGQFGRTKQPTISRTSSNGVSYLEPKEYIVGGTTVKGAQYLDAGVLVTISKLTVGEKVLVPGDATANAVKNLWDQGLLDDVKLNISDIRGDSVFFEIEIVERPRVSRFDLTGLKKGEIDDIQDKIKDKNGNDIYHETSKGYWFKSEFDSIKLEIAILVFGSSQLSTLCENNSEALSQCSSMDFLGKICWLYITHLATTYPSRRSAWRAT
jgi:outer membrane protein assembly factor BamA